MKLEKYLSKKDTIQLIECNYDSIKINTISEFKNHILKFKNLFHFDAAACAYMNVKKFIGLKEPAYDMINVSYPDEWVSRYIEERYSWQDRVTMEFIVDFQTKNFSEVIERKYQGDKNIVVQESESYGIVDGFISGERNKEFTNGSVFYWAGKTVENNERSRLIIKYITPHLTYALKRVIEGENNTNFSLSKREIEVLTWLKEGKSSWEISIILAISKRTVDYHTENIKAKLDAATRLQAVAIAIENKLFDY